MACPKARSRSTGGAPGPSGGGAAEEGRLELALGVVEQRRQQAGAVAETAEDGALADDAAALPPPPS